MEMTIPVNKSKIPTDRYLTIAPELLTMIPISNIKHKPMDMNNKASLLN